MRDRSFFHRCVKETWPKNEALLPFPDPTEPVVIDPTVPPAVFRGKGAILYNKLKPRDSGVDKLLASFLSEVQEIEVTDKPATTEAPPAEKAFVRTISPINPENETVIVEAGKQGQSRATSYPITYHGGPVMTAPGTIR